MHAHALPSLLVSFRLFSHRLYHSGARTFRFVRQPSWLVVMSRVLRIFVLPLHTRIMYFYMSPQSFHGSIFDVNDPSGRFARRSSRKLFDFGSCVYMKELLTVYACSLRCSLGLPSVGRADITTVTVVREYFSSGVTQASWKYIGKPETGPKNRTSTHTQASRLLHPNTA